ncbi:MAG: FAD-dependent oxidoreductase [Mogibacterium sp.]|nr:FAD-dependent oxidoreductase [Mogibacterium sp.]
MKINSVTVKNRIVFEPMGNSLAELDGACGDKQIAFYGARARGGVGLIMSEACSVDSKRGRGNIKNLCIDRDELIPGYEKLAEEVHKYGSIFFLEIYHPGAEGHCDDNGGLPMMSPSGIENGMTHEPVVKMTPEEIKMEIQYFIDGAVRAQKAGLDGVVIHAAHGYLINQFLSSHTNKRTDEYGGSEENRARFCVEIIEGIRKACGPDYPIAVRISADEYLDYCGFPKEEGITIDLAKNFSKMFVEAGADMIDVSSGNYESMNTAWEPTSFDQGWKSHLVREIRKVVNVPLSCVSVIRDPAYAEELLQEGATDFVGSARQHLADPDWSAKAEQGREKEIRKCVSCLNCMKTLIIPDMRCAINAEACMETEYCELRKDGDGKTVVVIGGGPAGMEAARVLSLRGFKVVLIEKDSKLGGQLNLASVPPMKEKLKTFISYLSEQMELLGVEVLLDTEASVELVSGYDPYDPVVPKSISGIDKDFVYTSTQVLNGSVSLKDKKVVVVGCGMNGLETAEYLVAEGNTVSSYDMLPQVATGEHFQNIIDIEMRIGPVVPQNTNHKLLSIEDGKVIFENLENNETVEAECDNVVLSMGMRPKVEFAEQFSEMPNYRVIGTNVKYGSIALAVSDAYKAAYEL